MSSDSDQNIGPCYFLTISLRHAISHFHLNCNKKESYGNLFVINSEICLDVYDGIDPRSITEVDYFFLFY